MHSGKERTFQGWRGRQSLIGGPEKMLIILEQLLESDLVWVAGSHRQSSIAARGRGAATGVFLSAPRLYGPGAGSVGSQLFVMADHWQ